ncbi:hypothetical protein FH972_014836 [Carpinus fangiana]|uniref:Uncharacterized protein n=1 Tax=Carpinus fangiana TaxID=176857 RepID=A0A5N6RBA1_9ROSI|nr:hypothetical protein FH972_014836 [Carpinus fangiana]
MAMMVGMGRGRRKGESGMRGKGRKRRRGREGKRMRGRSGASSGRAKVKERERDLMGCSAGIPHYIAFACMATFHLCSRS